MERRRKRVRERESEREREKEGERESEVMHSKFCLTFTRIWALFYRVYVYSV